VGFQLTDSQPSSNDENEAKNSTVVGLNEDYNEAGSSNIINDQKKTAHTFLRRLQQARDSEKAAPLSKKRFQLFTFDSINEDAEGYPTTRFDCVFDLAKQLFYVQPPVMNMTDGEGGGRVSAGGSVKKSVVLTLLDVAEALGSQKIYILIDPGHPSFAVMARMFLYLGFTMKSSKKASKLLSGGSVVLEYDIVWSDENESATSEEEGAPSVGSTQDEDGGSPPFSYRNDLDFDEFDDGNLIMGKSYSSESMSVTHTPPFTYRER